MSDTAIRCVDRGGDDWSAIKGVDWSTGVAALKGIDEVSLSDRKIKGHTYGLVLRWKDEGWKPSVPAEVPAAAAEDASTKGGDPNIAPNPKQ